MSSHRPVSKYAGAVATGLWTLGWASAADHAAAQVTAPLAGAVLANLIATGACSMVGCVMTYRIVRPGFRPDPTEKETQYPAESWGKRVTGWVGLFVWCAAAVLWNLMVYRVAIRAVAEHQTFGVLIMVFFSLPGWILLNLLFVSLGVMLDPLFARDETVKRWP